MPRSTAETLKQIQKQGLSISIISADSPKPVAVETGSKEMRPKQIAVVSETLPINSRSASSTENKPTVSQVRQISNATVETRSTTQSASLANQTAQTGANNKLSPVSSTSEMKLQSSQKLNNPNSVENKCQFSASNRNAQTEKNQSNVRHPQNASVPENKAQSNRNMLTFSGALDVKPNRNIPVESKTSIIHPRTQNQNVTTDSKTNSNQSRLVVASPPLEGKTNSNPGRLLSQSNSTPVLDKSIGRNQLLVTEIKTPNQCKIIPVKQSDIKTASAPKGHQNVKVITQPRAISQFQPSAVRVSANSNNENSSEAQSTGVNIMPKTSVKRVAAATSTPVSANTRKYIKIASSSVSDQSGSQSDINALSSDESPVKEKKVFNLRSITPGLTITPVQTSTPSASTSTKKPVESNQNIIVICPSCSQCSYNMTSCDSCHEVFTSTPVRYHLKNAQADSASIVVTQNVTTNIQKTMNVVYHISPNQNFKFQQTQQLVKVSPRRGRPKRRYVEPVCYTLSSDEEEALPFESIPDDINRQILYSHDLEENPESEHSSNSDMMQEENPEFDDPQYPGVTRIGTRFVSKHGLNHDMEEGEEDEEQEDEEMEHEMESEEELMDEVGLEQPEFDEEDEELEEEEEEEIPPDEEERFMPQFNKMQSLLPKKIVLKCRSIRIGSYKIHPEEHTNSLHVTITDRSLYFLAPLITDNKTFVQIMLMATDVGNMLIHFGKCLPIIFVLTTESFGEYVRRTLHMNKSHSELFLPKSNDFKKNKLTFLIDSLTDDQRTFMRQIFPGKNKMQEIDQKEANEILVKSTPNVTNVVKITQDSHVSSSPSSQAAITVAGLPPGLSSQALSITKVTVKPGPPAPVVKILTYPPPPQTGGIAINTADLATLEEGEFLNDAILDFYLKYVFYEKLSPRDREKTHIFSSFFYPRLTQKPDRIRAGDDGPKTMQVRRHNQVKTWTKHVDIFSKDYIVIPVNQHNHWFLAFICYPGHIPDPPVEKAEPKTAKATDIVTSSNDHVTNKVIIKEETSITEDSQTQADIVNNDSSYEVEEPPDSDEDDSSELPERSPNNNVTYYEGGRRKETPCILIFDSLSGPNRWRIASTLREYLEMEWKMRKGTRKVFDKSTMQGFIVKCPQQTNFSDCGLYVLQYVESFFENPITHFGNPMDVTSWFTDTKISKKRQELKELILNLQKKYQTKQTNLSGVTIKKIIQPSASPIVSSTQTDNNR
ncbi:uncharacterized protein [Parasteatoda tepidariorum]|uniref:uncharacterized protein isoform X2 n=1 Tax=Parasteatoda tepidariorum TaxID=114398 RepID=UPI001C7198D0|nr:uncharacterized protein LOC107438926 isoform X2 [Parasteatoda tepidariorum]